MSESLLEEPAARQLVTQGVAAICESIAMLSSLELKSEPRVPPSQAKSVLGGLVGPMLLAETHVPGRNDLCVGMMVSESFALKISSSMLIMPHATEFTQELLAAYDEVINIAIGVWNPAMPSADWRWDNSVAARSIRTLDFKLALDEFRRRGLGFMAYDVEVEGKRQPLILYGHLPWSDTTPTEEVVAASAIGPHTMMRVASSLGDPSKLLEGAVPPRGPRTRTPSGQMPRVEPARPDSGRHERAEKSTMSGRLPRVEPAPALSGRRERAQPGAHADHHREAHDTHERLEAALAFVDKTGALKAWLLEQLNNPEFVFTKTHEPPTGTTGQVIVLVDPSELRDLRVRKTIVMRRA